jgi:hypothetical protein
VNPDRLMDSGLVRGVVDAHHQEVLAYIQEFRPDGDREGAV